MRDFLYKLINYLIQGSAADLTKEAIIAWHGAPRRGSRFLVTVYDEINISAHPEVKHYEMNLLRDAMEAARLSVPMLSSGKEGPTWGDLQKCA
jgi:DNA polymerase I-like protein with 3'-5' exonuclease and polymerase domains